MRKSLFFLVSCTFVFIFSNVAPAQNTFIDEQSDRFFRDGLELFEKKQYATAQRKFQQYLSLNLDDDKYFQAEYYQGVCALYLENPNAESLILDFVSKYSSHPKARSAYYKLGGYYFNQNDYPKTIEYLERIDISNVKTDEDIEASFQLGYAYFQQKSYRRAKAIFTLIKGGDHDYSTLSSYYAGYIAYLDGEYEAAIADLEKASQDRSLKRETYVLIASIYYQQGKYDDVLLYVQELESQGQVIPTDLNLLAGGCYFLKENYERTIFYLDEYMKDKGKEATRGVNYRLGYAYFKVNQQREAVPYLSTAADGQDTLAQVAAYHLGISYVSLDQKQLAVAAFDKCRKLNFEKQMRELGAFYYVKVNFDIGDFGNAIEGSDFYLKYFPRGEHLNEVYSLSTEAYMNTGDYAKALSHIRQVRDKSPRIKEAYQELAYNKAVLDFSDSEFRSAVNMLRESLRYPEDNDLSNKAYFWLGEIYSFGNRYDSALLYYDRIRKPSLEYDKALYGIAYAHYNTQSYAEAIPYFRDFVQSSNDPNRDKKIDALTRLADCYFVTKDFNNAIRIYELAIENDSPLEDYIYFQRGVINKNIGQLNKADETFSMVISNYPESKYRETALYEKALLYFEEGRREGSIEWFSQLIEGYPESQLLPFALGRRALAYNLTGNEAMAVTDYKRIIDIDPTHSMAESAIQSLQEIEAQGYPVRNLSRYKRIFSEANPTSLVTLQGEYETARRPFNDGNYTQAVKSLKLFLKKYPNTALSGDAYYTMGYSYEILGDVPNAIKSYEQVTGNQKAKSVRNLADLEYQRGNFAQAIDYYLDVQSNTSKKRYLDAALEGLMKSYFCINDFDATQTYANQIINENITRHRSAAELYLGKVFLAQEQYLPAIAQLQKTVRLADDENGAEAQYLVGVALSEQDEYEASIQALIEVRNKYESYTNWVYQAYLLIADNYVDLGNDFQAKATLNSIIENSNDSVVVQLAKEKLKEI